MREWCSSCNRITLRFAAPSDVARPNVDDSNESTFLRAEPTRTVEEFAKYKV